MPKLLIDKGVTAKQILAGINEWARVRHEKNPDDKQTKALWDVFSALRGPDSADQSKLKYHTTGAIRRVALPHLAEGHGLLSSRSDFVMPTDYSHFERHIRWAAEALGLVKPNARS
jgi:hypothetical protein